MSPKEENAGRVGNVNNERRKDIPQDDTRKENLSEEESSDEDENLDSTSFLFLLQKTLYTTGRSMQRIINTVFVQDDEPPYGRGTLGIFSGVYISYMQNILLLGVIFLRLPWIVGVLSLSLASISIFLAFATILFSSFSIAAIATNGSDRLYGGPFTTIAYSLGNQVALVAGVMLCLANCGFTGLCLTICTELIHQYILRPSSGKANLAKLAFENVS
uniref:Amino acid permease/ SLC12A domain-containing protein n=1 Tax=Setaria digitata TaxID=48799 RepID=A0A915Q0Y6_9BILA